MVHVNNKKRFIEEPRVINKHTVDLQNKFMATLDDRLRLDLAIVLLQDCATSPIYAGAHKEIEDSLQCIKYAVIAREKNTK